MQKHYLVLMIIGVVGIIVGGTYFLLERDVESEKFLSQEENEDAFVFVANGDRVGEEEDRVERGITTSKKDDEVESSVEDNHNDDVTHEVLLEKEDGDIGQGVFCGEVKGGGAGVDMQVYLDEEAPHDNTLVCLGEAVANGCQDVWARGVPEKDIIQIYKEEERCRVRVNAVTFGNTVMSCDLYTLLDSTAEDSVPWGDVFMEKPGATAGLSLFVLGLAFFDEFDENGVSKACRIE
jgi:hypothetical protein